MVKHTPGPWHVGAQNDQLYVIDKHPATSNDYPLHDAETDAIAKVYHGNYSAANALVLASAPDLLNALTGLADAAEKRGIPCDAARAAIARATGEPA